MVLTDSEAIPTLSSLTTSARKTRIIRIIL